MKKFIFYISFVVIFGALVACKSDSSTNLLTENKKQGPPSSAKPSDNQPLSNEEKIREIYDFFLLDENGNYRMLKREETCLYLKKIPLKNRILNDDESLKKGKFNFDHMSIDGSIFWKLFGKNYLDGNVRLLHTYEYPSPIPTLKEYLSNLDYAIPKILSENKISQYTQENVFDWIYTDYQDIKKKLEEFAMQNSTPTSL